MGGIATVTTKGQVTIPAPIRKQYDIDQNDKLLFTPSAGGFFVKPLTKSFISFGGSIKPTKRPENFHKIREKVEKEISKTANSY